MNQITRILTVGPSPQEDPAVAEGARLLREGSLVAFPTETVYGLGADACNAEAVAKVFAAKQRPSDNPLIVHLAHGGMTADYADPVPPETAALAKAFWPGPLTLIMPAAEKVRRTLARDLGTVALRVPGHPVAQALLSLTGFGVAAPSANLSGRPSPTTAAHVAHDLEGRIPLILDGGPCPVGIESTVLDLSGDVPTILRPGQITCDQIASVLGREVPTVGGDLHRSPGTRYRHYMPETPLFLVEPNTAQNHFERFFDEHPGKVGYLGIRPLSATFKHRVDQRYCSPDQMAAQLYAALRAFDGNGAAWILVDMPPEHPVYRGLPTGSTAPLVASSDPVTGSAKTGDNRFSAVPMSRYDERAETS